MTALGFVCSFTGGFFIGFGTVSTKIVGVALITLGTCLIFFDE